MRRALGCSVLLAVLVVTGCGSSAKSKRRDAVNAYLGRVQTIQLHYRPSFDLANQAYRDFSKGKTGKRQVERLRRAEVSILAAGVDLRRDGATTFYGFSIAKEIREREGARRLTAHGTLYKALDRMERAGLLASCWEDPLVAARERRPRRRLYEVTSAGERALAKAQAEAPRPAPRPAEGLAGL